MFRSVVQKDLVQFNAEALGYGAEVFVADGLADLALVGGAMTLRLLARRQAEACRRQKPVKSRQLPGRCARLPGMSALLFCLFASSILQGNEPQAIYFAQ